MVLGLVGIAAVLAARLISCIITSSIITRFSQRNVLILTTLHLSLHATLGTIDTRWLAIVVLGGLRGPGTYGGRLKRDICLIFSSSSALPHLRPQSCSRRCGELQREAFQEGDQLRHRFDPPAPRSPDTGVFEASLEFSENFDCRC